MAKFLLDLSKISYCGVCSKIISFNKPCKYLGSVTGICHACRMCFKRYANKVDDVKCLTGRGNCDVTIGVNFHIDVSDDNSVKVDIKSDEKPALKCISCRLNKCLGVGMRHDLILDENEKKVRFRRTLNKYKSQFYVFEEFPNFGKIPRNDLKPGVNVDVDKKKKMTSSSSSSCGRRKVDFDETEMSDMSDQEEPSTDTDDELDDKLPEIF